MSAPLTAGGSGSGGDGEAGAEASKDSHYAEVAAEAYEQAFFYSSPEYRRWVMGHVERYFGLPDPEARIVDLGGGTGNFWQEHAGWRRVLCVDASREMLAKAVDQRAVEPMLADALQFALMPPEQMSYTHVLLKELVHHIPADDIGPMYAGLFSQLQPGGVALTITRPQEVDYPLFARAREIWRERQPPASAFVAAMEAAGFEVEVAAHDYTATLPKATWLAMMRSRFWSTFSYCSNEELEAGIAEVNAVHAGQDTVQFVDRLLFLVARKPAGAAALPPPPALLLSAAQREQYARDGFAGPVDVLSPEEAAAALEAYESYEHGLGGTVTGDWRFKTHLLLPWVWELARRPRLLVAVSDALGGVRNLLCWSTDWFVKDSRDGGYTTWHQDSAYVALSPADDVVTAWLALTPSTPANGCLFFLPGSHHALLEHEDTYAPGNLLLKGQAIPALEATGAVGQHIALAPGQASLHHIQLAHRSGPAQPGAPRRVGLALRYMAAHVHQDLEPRDSVTVVSGTDTYQLYVHEQEPKSKLRKMAQLQALRELSRGSDTLQLEWDGADLTTCRRIKLDGEGQVSELMLMGTGLLDVPDAVGHLDSLVKLVLTQNALRDLPTSLAGLTCLQALVAGDNQLRTVPQVVCELVSLQQLLLNLNPIASIPGSVAGLQRLEWLDLSECMLAAIPAGTLGTLTNLARLDLHSNKIQALPPDISNLRRLDHLSLHSNDLAALPPEIGGCTAMTWLSLNANKLQELPSSIGEMTNLVRISLHINRLTALPPELGALEQMEAMSLHSNELTALPPSLSRLTGCARLSLYHNRLASLPEEIGGMRSLQELWCSANQLISVPVGLSQLTALKRLWLDQNRLTSLPSQLSALNNLQELYIDDNPGLQELPPELQGLAALRRVSRAGGAGLAAPGGVPVPGSGGQG